MLAWLARCLQNSLLFNSMLILATENKTFFSCSFLTYCRSYGPIHVLPGLNNTIMFGCTSQSCSIGLRPADCGGHLSRVHSLSSSRNQFEMVWLEANLKFSDQPDWTSSQQPPFFLILMLVWFQPVPLTVSTGLNAWSCCAMINLCSLTSLTGVPA